MNTCDRIVVLFRLNSSGQPFFNQPVLMLHHIGLKNDSVVHGNAVARSLDWSQQWSEFVPKCLHPTSRHPLAS